VDRSLQELREWGDPKTRDALTHVEKTQRSYQRRSLPIGRIRNKRTGSITKKLKRINLKRTHFAIKGQTQSGKTFGSSRIADVAYRSGMHVIFATDAKDEFKQSTEPHTEMADALLDDEIPEATPVVTLRPTVFRSLKGDASKLKDKNYWYSPDPTTLEEGEWQSILNVHDMTPTQQSKFKRIIQDASQTFEKTGYDPDIFHKIIDDMELGKTDPSHYHNTIEILEKSQFFQADQRKDFIQMMKGVHLNGEKRRCIPSFNFELHEDLDERMGYQYGLLTLILKKTVRAKKTGRLQRPVLIIIDEAYQFVEDPKHSSTKYLTSSIQQDTSKGISYGIITQDFSPLPDQIFGMTKYRFYPQRNEEDIKTAIKEGGGMRGHSQAYMAANYINKKTKKFDFLVTDTSETTWDIMRFIPPVSKHS